MREEILNLDNISSIAIMGGTFNPIHYGHMIAAEAVRQEFGVEKIIFIPSGQPPHKTNRNIVGKEHRYLMTFLATMGNPYFDVSRCEIDREGYTYTVDTIKFFKRICPENTKIYFITGADAVNEIFTWKDSEKLVTMCEFIAVTRPGFTKDSICEQVAYIRNKYNSAIHFLEIPAIDISSSAIRERIQEGKSIKYLLPENVENYIYEYNLYKKDIMEEIGKKVKSKLSPKRFQHTMGVVKEAEKLAVTHNQSVKKASIAALLHDYAKEMPFDEKIDFCEKYGIPTDEIQLSQPDLLHSFIGAQLAKNEFSIKDIDILNAIAYHTTGRAGMSPLEKIIFLADVIEPNRKNFEGLKKIRKTAYEDLNKAMVLALETTMEYTKSRNRKVHPLGPAALEDIKDKMNK